MKNRSKQYQNMGMWCRMRFSRACNMAEAIGF